MIFVGSAYTYLQEWLPNVGQHVLRNGMADFVGLGRMMLSYPDLASGRAGRPAARAQAHLPHVQRLHDRSAAWSCLGLLSARSAVRRPSARADSRRGQSSGSDMNPTHPGRIRPDRRGPHGVSLAVRGRRLRALRPAALLSVLRAGARVEPAGGDVRQRLQQDLRRAGLRLLCRTARRSLWSAPPAARRHRHGRRRARRALVRDDAQFVLLLLHVQRARLRVWRSAAEPGASVAMVRQGARQGDGHRLSRHRRWRRPRAAARLRADAGARLARSAAHPRPADDCRGIADGVLRRASLLRRKASGDGCAGAAAAAGSCRGRPSTS